MNTLAPKMKVEIWSDIQCPFCYIGKRNFESALAQFPNADSIEVEWKSFQLNPSIPDNVTEDVYSYLATVKGISLETSLQMHANVVEMAKKAGLHYNFDKAIVANTFNTHRLLQFAKSKGLGDEAKETILHAYFIDGKNINDKNTLYTLGEKIGFSPTEVDEALNNAVYAQKVKSDIQESREIGVTGVPFFVFDRAYAISGAHPVDSFIETLEKAFKNWEGKPQVKSIESNEVNSCTPGGGCC